MIEYHEGPDKYLSLKMKKMRKKENINNSNEKDLFYLEHLMSSVQCNLEQFVN